MLRALVASLALACLACVTPISHAEDASPVLSKIVASGKLRVGMSGDQPPLNMQSKSGGLIGLEVDLARVLAAAMRVELEIIEKPFPDLLGALGTGEIDMVMSGMTITPERNLRAAFVGPYFISGTSILTKRGPLASADEAEDINAAELTLAALANSTSEAFVKAFAPRAKLVQIQNYEEGVKLVKEGKATAMVADMPACVVSVLRNPNSGLVTLSAPLTVEPIGIAVPPGDPLLVNLVENYLDALEGMGLMDRLRQAWVHDPGWLREIR
jgi:polar amino acid transport system substrate-binding protein